jgi:hypothetical protein
MRRYAKKLIAALPTTIRSLWKEWCAASREAEGQSHLDHGSQDATLSAERAT